MTCHVAEVKRSEAFTYRFSAIYYNDSSVLFAGFHSKGNRFIKA